MDLKELSDYINQLKEAHGWSSHELSVRSGLSAGFLSQLINNKMRSVPKMRSLDALARAFNIPKNTLHHLAYSTLEIEDKTDWETLFRSKLAERGFSNKYITEIISYIDTVELKQKLEEKN